MRQGWLTAITIGMLVMAAPARADHSQLAGQWHLDEISGFTAADSSGHGLDGTAGDVDIVAGRFGNAVRFDGSEVIRVADSPLLEPQRLTVTAWVRAANVTTSDYIVAKGGDAGCTNSSYALSTGAGGLQFSVRMDSSSNAFVSPVADPASIWNGQWHAVAGTYDGSTVRLYVDGVEVGSGTPAVTTIPYGRQEDSFTIGSYPSCPNNVYDYQGDVDEVRVYNRALTSAEIGALQDPGATTPPVVPEPAAAAVEAAAVVAAADRSRPRPRRSSSPPPSRPPSSARAGSAAPPRPPSRARRSSSTPGTSTTTAASTATATARLRPSPTRSRRPARTRWR